MKVTTFKNTVAAALLLMAAGVPLASCVDDSYDMSKDIDLTMGLGSEGLQLKLGTTERIMLADLLEVDDNLQTDAANRYYLVEKGSTSVNFRVNSVSSSIDKAVLRPSYRVVDFDLVAATLPGTPTAIPVDAGTEIVPEEAVQAHTDFKFDVTGIGSDVKWIKRITPMAGTSVKLYLRLENNGTKLLFKDVKGLVVTLPDFLRMKNATQGTVVGNTYRLNDHIGVNAGDVYLGEAQVDYIHFADNNGEVKNGILHLSEDVAMKGNISFRAASAFQMTTGDYANLRLEIVTGDMTGDRSVIHIDNVTGRFAPVIEPVIEDIDVATDLPDFLRDDEVTVTASNPTIRFDADLRNIPVSLDLGAGLKGVKGGETIADIALPQSGRAEMLQNAKNTLYFYRDAQTGPFDPDGVAAGSRRYRVENISDLITRIPDVIKVDLAGGKVSVKDQDHTITLGREYRTEVDYRILVPFTFDAGLKIVYNDSITGMNKDLEDYQADGLQLTATIENAVPMQLLVSGTAIGVDGRPLPGIHISEAIAAPAGGEKQADGTYVTADTPVTLVVTLDDPADLRRLDRIDFKVKAGADAQSGTLCSDQYICVKDIRLKLTGNIIADFN